MNRIVYSKILCRALALSTLSGITSTTIAVEDAPWAPDTRFEHTIDVGALPGGSQVEFKSYPWWLCSPWVGPPP